MKKFLRITSLICVAGFTVGALSGCGIGFREETGNNKEIDVNMSQLYVSNYEGGYGRKWLDNAAKRFEEKYKNTSFEEGKTGVQIKISSSINGTAGPNLIAGLATNSNEVFFTEDTFYYDVMANGGAADITDIVTEELTAYGENKSIEDKMDDAIVSFFKTSENKYFGLPHYEAFYGITYDLDLFDAYGFWIADDGEYIKPGQGTLGKGPDNIAGTYDDGLPATFDEFFALCDYMLDKGVTPFTWGGAHPNYATSAMYELWADYEGKDQFYLNFSLNGTAKDLVNSVSGDGTMNAQGKFDDMMPETEITMDNGYLLQRQAGKYVALNFMKRIAENNGSKYCTTNSFSPSEGNITAQGTYLLSRLESEKKPIAFLLEGVWWENEADESGYFDRYSIYGETRQTRRFGFMPFPKATTTQLEDENNRRTISTNCNHTLAFKSYRVNTDGTATIAWQGLDNFKRFIKEITSDPTMTGRFFNSLTVYAVNLFVGTVLAILFSYYIYKQYKGTNFFRVMLFLPSIISSVVLVMIYKYVVDRAIPSLFGIDPLMSGMPKQVFSVVIVYCVMMGFGSNVLMYSNGMSRIPDSLTEYAKLEGCTPVKEFFLITFPLVYPTIETFLIIGISNIFMDQANEFTFFGMNSDLVAGKQTLGYFLYIQVFGNTTTMSTYPYASAAGLVLTMITIPVVMAARFILDKFDKGAEF